MKTIIAGGRTLTDSKPVVEAIRASGFVITEVISGGAPGADHYGELWAALYAVPLRVFPADWKAHGKAAGPIRNRQMAQEADALIAIWDGRSKGTANMIRTALSLGLRVYIHHI